MFSKPTLDDYERWIDWHLHNATEETEFAINAVKRRNAAAGAYQSGSTVIGVFKEVQVGFEKGVTAALGELKRAIRTTTLDGTALRNITETRLKGFADEIKAATNSDKLKEFAGDKPVDERIAKIDQHLVFSLRQFDVGFMDPAEPEIPPTTNNHVAIGVMSGGAVQQGTSHLTQTIHNKIDTKRICEALDHFESSIISSANIPRDYLADLTADIATLRGQLAKTQPSVSILHEAGRSLRNVTEGALGGMLSHPAASSATALWQLLGI